MTDDFDMEDFLKTLAKGDNREKAILMYEWCDRMLEEKRKKEKDDVGVDK